MSESWIEEEVRAALNETYRPAPALLSASMAAIRSDKPTRRNLTWVAALVSALLAVGTVAVFVSTRSATNHVNHTNPAIASLPKPVPQPITRTSPGAQVAWLSLGQQPYLVGVDPSGQVVARLDESTAPGIAGAYGVWRSADGSTIYSVGSNKITAYSALDATMQRTYTWIHGNVVADAFSPDGRWLALLTLDTVSPDCSPDAASGCFAFELQVIDLQTGSSQMVPAGHDPNANLPGMSCAGSSCGRSVVWGMVVFAPNSARLYTLTDWGGPTRLGAFSLEGGKLTLTGAAVDGQGGKKFPSCAGPAMASKVIAGGSTLVAFCHVDGAVWFFDLSKLVSSGVVNSNQSNPFALSPIFTPDGHLLYLDDGGSMQVIDLSTRKLLGPVATPTKIDQSGPFAWLITNAYAGGVASTVPLSPDGLTLYSATNDGVMTLRVPDLKPIAKLAPGFSANEVWVSGDGRTIYAISDDGRHLLVMGNDGSHQKSVTFPNPVGGFIASEHG